MVTSNVDAVYDGHVGNHARFVSHDVAMTDTSMLLIIVRYYYCKYFILK